MSAKKTSSTAYWNYIDESQLWYQTLLKKKDRTPSENAILIAVSDAQKNSILKFYLITNNNEETKK